MNWVPCDAMGMDLTRCALPRDHLLPHRGPGLHGPLSLSWVKHHEVETWIEQGKRRTKA
jgi:hypothetical protein